MNKNEKSEIFQTDNRWDWSLGSQQGLKHMPQADVRFLFTLSSLNATNYNNYIYYTLYIYINIKMYT